MNLHDKDQSPVLTGFPYSSASATEEVTGWPSPALFKSERASRATVFSYQSRNFFEETVLRIHHWFWCLLRAVCAVNILNILMRRMDSMHSRLHFWTTDTGYVLHWVGEGNTRPTCLLLRVHTVNIKISVVKTRQLHWTQQQHQNQGTVTVTSEIDSQRFCSISPVDIWYSEACVVCLMSGRQSDVNQSG